MQRVCVIGGSRYFGKRLIKRLLTAGIEVTVVNRGSSAPPSGAVHVVADRDDEGALAAALGDRTFDVVVDQVCYTPRQADIARRVFAERTRRYVMTSTIEVYEALDADRPVDEAAVDTAAWPVDPELPWGDAAFVESHYGEGKRQAEAVFTQRAPFDFVAVRTGHVLGGDDDFTGRLDHHVRRIRAGRPVAVHEVNHPSTYIHVEEIADFLFWAAGAEFTGPVNACSHGELSTADICAEIAAQLGKGTAVSFVTVDGGSGGVDGDGGEGGGGAEISPFSFARRYGMDNSRATGLGFGFARCAEWLPAAVADSLGAGNERRKDG